MRDGAVLVPRPDYTIPAQRLFTTVTTATIVANKVLDIMYSGNSSVQLTLPSWIPDWGSDLPYTLTMSIEENDICNATGSSLQVQVSHRT